MRLVEPAHQLPKQIADMLRDVKTHMETFKTCAPHTIQRIAELVLEPRAHYKALAPYLHAVDRVVRVTSGTSAYPLPSVVPDMSAMELNGGEDARDPAAAVAWSNPTAAALGTDEALGGALLTPIPWLRRPSPETNGDAASSASASASASASPGPGPAPGPASAGAQIHSEGTETIDGPNGVGSIETVSVSVNGVPSTGHARGVTQGELLRQEQRAGVVPVSQLTAGSQPSPPADEDGGGLNQEDEQVPHARGPQEIGVSDTGPQGVTTSYVGDDGVLLNGIDVEAAVGRRRRDERQHQTEAHARADDDGDDDANADAASSPSSTESAGTKREAETQLQGEPAKKAREDHAPQPAAVAGVDEAAAAAAAHEPTPTPASTTDTTKAQDGAQLEATQPADPRDNETKASV
ncbi:hypothetical protein UVI_02006500 [Ustilaginoidea virens]|uniref:Protein phosphatase 4 core regulatory subunit R2 n=1 Tax=Ustilaginoidea virens TaxID=1159556 RepID=A0A1B5KYQ8_USTVR|nr:hypothetical protein UVI_02006500 [Ustilaginoidea virens]